MTKSIKTSLFLTFQFFIYSIIFATPEQGFLVKGKILGLKDGITLYLIQYSTGDTIATDISKNGKFNFKGSVPKGTEYYFLRIDTALSRKRSTEFLLINDKLDLSGIFTNWPKVVLKRSKPNDEYLQLVRLWSSTQESASQKDSVRDFIDRHKNSLYIADLIRRVDKYFSLIEKEQMYNNLTQRAKDSYFGELLNVDLVFARKGGMIYKGATLPDFPVALKNGNKVNALEIISKAEYTLIDFWASWCKPCREAVPSMKKVYEAFNKKGFNILSIAVSDKDPNWRRAMEEDSTTWVNARDAEGICNKIFDIPAIPGFILVNRTGTLISYYCPGSAVAPFGPSLNVKKDSLYQTIKQIFAKDIEHSDTVISTIPIKIGNKVPDISLGELASNPLVRPKLSDYRGKLLILDFWSTYCTVCIAQFPKIEAIQRQFDDKVVILPVGFDGQKEGEVRNFLIKSKGTSRELKLPSVIQKPTDSLLMSLFPFSGLPHEVWIDSEGTLIGLTDHRAITTYNIETVLSGKTLSFSINKPLKLSLSQNKPFLVNQGSNPNSVCGSAFTSYIDSLSCISSGKLIRKNDALRYYQVNQTVLGHYKYAYKMQIPELTYNWGGKKIIIEQAGGSFYKDWDETKDMDNWQYDEFNRRNLFAYELILPSNYSDKEAYQYIVMDLDRFFRFKSRIENRNTKYLALIRTGVAERFQSVTDKASISRENDTFLYKNISTKYLSGELNSILPSSLEIIDETNYKGNINIILSVKDAELSSIRSQLQRYGFDLITKEKKLDRLVIINLLTE